MYTTSYTYCNFLYYRLYVSNVQCVFHMNHSFDKPRCGTRKPGDGALQNTFEDLKIYLYPHVLSIGWRTMWTIAKISGEALFLTQMKRCPSHNRQPHFPSLLPSPPLWFENEKSLVLVGFSSHRCDHPTRFCCGSDVGCPCYFERSRQQRA